MVVKTGFREGDANYSIRFYYITQNNNIPLILTGRIIPVGEKRWENNANGTQMVFLVGEHFSPGKLSLSSVDTRKNYFKFLKYKSEIE